MESKPFRNQRYKDLKAQVAENGILFTDAEFPPAPSSISFDRTRSRGVDWKRPNELVSDPVLFRNEGGINGIEQGEVANCWFVAACITLSRDKSMLNKVIPNGWEQGWSTDEPENYCGIFHFQFWRFGRWIDVVIDDLLPTRNETLIFGCSRDKDEFWFPLMEKAYSKICGCYESLNIGTIGEAFVDLTGGILETIELDHPLWKTEEQKICLFKTLKDAFGDNALLAAAIKADTVDQHERLLECGLIKGHIYAITTVHQLSSNSGHTLDSMMMQLQNPWGSRERWMRVKLEKSHKLEMREKREWKKDAGQLWMPWSDICRYFSVVSICYQFNNSVRVRYSEFVFEGSWKINPYRDRAGGCINFKSTFLNNPQYRFDVLDEETEVFVMLQQQDVRERRHQGASLLTIGMILFRVEDHRVHRLDKLPDVQAVSEYTNSRSVLLKVKCPRPGRYVVVPTTYMHGQEGEFLLRIYSHSVVNAEELQSEIQDTIFGA